MKLYGTYIYRYFFAASLSVVGDSFIWGQIIGPTLFEPTLQQTDLLTDRMVFGPIHGC